jgi:carboxyl-terminal processing protease
MKRRIVYGMVSVALGVVLVTGGWIYVNSAHAAEKDSAYPSLELFSSVLEKVRNEYVDGKKLTYRDLIYGALRGMINTLDPHSEFMDPAKYGELQNDTEGKFGGLGIVIEIKDHYLTVLAPMEDTPGSRAGILAGDRIIKIEGKPVGLTGEAKGDEPKILQDSVDQLRGDPGTPVTITVERPSTGKATDYTIKREEIKVDMVKDINNKKEFPLSEDKIGYVRLVQFGEQTSADLETALRKLKSEGMQAMILDLRGNPGGLLDQAVDVCSKFLPQHVLVVSTEGQNPDTDSKSFFSSGRGDELNGMPMVVLVNYNSASAAEIVSGCLKDRHRALIMGEKTFGKGSVQSIIPLQDGSALRLTTAKYYTPSHNVIHGVGITPDCVVPVPDEETEAIDLKWRRPSLDTLSPSDRAMVKDVDDEQYDRAVDELKGMLIFAQRAPADRDIASKAENKAAVNR